MSREFLETQQPGERDEILVADDDPNQRSLIAYALRLSGFHVTECRDVQELALRLGSKRWFALVANVTMADFSFVSQPVHDAAALMRVFLVNGRAGAETPSRPAGHGNLRLFDESTGLSEMLNELTSALTSESPGDLC